MDTYHVVLYIHLLALFVGIGAGAILLVCLFQLRAAQTLAEAVTWGRVAGKTASALPVATSVSSAPRTARHRMSTSTS